MSDQQIKQILVLRKDLKVRRGKMHAQAAHASIAFLTNRLRLQSPIYPMPHDIELSEVEEKWINDIFTKICVGVDSEEELLEIHRAALINNVESHLITDAGLTEFHGVPTPTAVGIGPDFSEKLDPITGHLKLL